MSYLATEEKALSTGVNGVIYTCIILVTQETQEHAMYVRLRLHWRVNELPGNGRKSAFDRCKWRHLHVYYLSYSRDPRTRDVRRVAFTIACK